jgi:hypothetical protein
MNEDAKERERQALALRLATLERMRQLLEDYFRNQPKPTLH